jgi:hypothetical protein
VTHKIETFDEGRRYRDLGILDEGEIWNGKTREEWGRWRRHDAAEEVHLFDEGHLWDPGQNTFCPWSEYSDKNENHTETFYSMFQAYPLQWKMLSLELRVDISTFVAGKDPVNTGCEMADWGERRVNALRGSSMQDDIAFVAQALSTRYHPRTRTDRRTFSIQERRLNWDWYGFVSKWDAARCAADISIDANDLADRHHTVARSAKTCDPLERWYQLVRFIAVDKKDLLTGYAQYAQLLYSIEYMFRLFAKDAWGMNLYPPDEDQSWKNEDLYGKGVPDDPLRHLEFVVNSYHLNPRPKLILLVEGSGEEESFPYIASKAMGHEFPPLGIEVRALGGVGEFTGKKRYDRLGAREKFIDDYHHRQTVVVLILDREGRVDTVTNNLLGARSKLYHKRMVTKPEYIRVWQRSIEFDNFSPAEIAATLTKLASGTVMFTAQEIDAAQSAYDQKTTDPLSELYQLKTRYHLNKIKCLRALADVLIEDVQQNGFEEAKKRRPLLQILYEVIAVAVQNHQPINSDIWKANQESGYFGNLVVP